MTQAGVILGTAAYMSPEQAGRQRDKRSDLWALGFVVLEMLTGRRVFTGETMSHVLARVLKSEPDWTTLPADTPPPIRRLLRRCLDKDRKRRLDSAADARLEMDEVRSHARGDREREQRAERQRPHGRRALRRVGSRGDSSERYWRSCVAVWTADERQAAPLGDRAFRPPRPSGAAARGRQ